MILERAEQNAGTRFLFNLALVVVVVAGLKLGAPILLPFALALFLAILTLPIVVWLQQRRVPRGPAVFLAVLVDLALFGLLVLLASQSLNDLEFRLDRYGTRLSDIWTSWIQSLQEATFPGANFLAEYLNPDILDPGQLFSFAGNTLATAFSFASSAFLVFLVLIFILAEATVFPAKFRAILGREQGHSSRSTKIVAEVQEYLGIKTFISLATGILLGAWCWVLDLDFPILLGLLAFVLNYVPTIGSIIASVPAMLLGLIQVGPGHALLVGVGYVLVNLGFGNLIEPNLLGRRLGLSTLVVILSLIFWGWVWGPVGALLAVPLTMVVKIMMENTADLKWVSILLDKAPPEPGVTGGAVEEMLD
ncbi:MAG: AI-2E family transporter [Gemmatimonadetes bacterium]|nr:AI-2E family transporter [Gemmatimonadota bacterium]NNM04389.1 AI-2E family transporter [Gemmatimonadota bacterium]